MFLFRAPRLRNVYHREYIPQRLLTASASTIKVYDITLRFFDQFLGRPARVSDLTDETVSLFARHRLQSVSKGTVKRDMDCLLALWRFCHAAGMLKKGPTIRAIHAPTPTPLALTREELAAVWEAIQMERRPVAINLRPLTEVPGPIWWSAVFLTCWDTAERVSAVFDLVEGNLDLGRRWIRFPASDRKGQAGDNLKAIHDDTATAIERLLGYYTTRRFDSRVFRWAHNRGSIWSRLGAIMVAAGLPNSREFKFHCVRKSSTSHLAAAGGDPVAHAGHSSEIITRRHYLDPRLTGGEAAPNLLFRPGE